MAVGNYFTPHQHGIVRRYYEHADTLTLQKLQELVSEIAVTTDARRAKELWDGAARALKKTPADHLRVARLVGERNTEALARLVADLVAGKVQAPTPPPKTSPVAPSAASLAATATPSAPATPTDAALPPETLKGAMRAFKKRLKVTQLDEESKLGGHRPTTGGAKARILAITPPHQYPRAVWDALVRQGELKYVGSGVYELRTP